MKAFLGLLMGVFFAAPACAQLGAGAVPDLSAFAGAIAASASGAPAAAPAGHALFTSGLTVPTVAPGSAARAIGAQLRTSLEAKSGPNPAFAQLETGMPATLTAIETGLEKQGFAPHDLGVAMAYTFLLNYETATHTKVPDQPSLVAARTVARAIASHWGQSFAKLTDKQKEDMYESLLVSTSLLRVFADQFDKAGKTTEAQTMRATAGQMFEKLIGTAPARVTIGPDGQISGLGAAATPAPTSELAPPAPLAAKGKVVAHAGSGHVAAGSGLRGLWRADWVENSYGIGGMQLLARNQTFAFDDAGDFFSGLPGAKGLSPEGMREIVAAEPNRGGRYELSGDQLALHYGNGETQTGTVHRSGGTIATVVARGKTLGRKIVPADGTRLSRTYTTERITNTGGGFVSGATTLSFTPDGHFTYGNQIGVQTNQVAGIHTDPRSAGTYEIKDGALVMRDATGRTDTYLIWTESEDLSKFFLGNSLYQ